MKNKFENDFYELDSDGDGNINTLEIGLYRERLGHSEIVSDDAYY